MMTSPTGRGDTARRGPRFPGHLSIAWTLTFGLAALLLAAIGLVMWSALGVATRNTFELQRSLAQATLAVTLHEVESHLGAAQQQAVFLRGLIESGELDVEDEARLADLMLGAMAATPQVQGIAFFHTDFRVLRVGIRDGKAVTLRGDWRHRPEIQEAMSFVAELGKPAWREVVWVEDFQAPHIAVAEPVYRDGAFIGYFFPVVSVSRLSAYLAGFDKPAGTHSFILYGRDRVLAHPSLSEGFAGLSPERPLPGLRDVGDNVLAAIWDEIVDDMDYMLAGSEMSGHVVAGSEEDYIYFYRELDRFGSAPWIIGVYFLESEVSTPFRRLALAGGLGLAVLLLAIGAGLFLARAIVRPVQRLAAASTEVQALELDAVQPLGRSLFSELDTASKAFDSMVAGLKWFETYVPKSLVLRLMGSGGSSVRSEERQVTVLFTDIVGFTHIARTLAPGELAELLNHHFSALGQAIENEGGTIDKYIGDSVMAFWGAPLDQPDHAERACRAAQAITGHIDADNRRRRAAGEEPIALRIGIHSGPAVVGNVGAPGRINYTLIGDTVNIAQRLENLGRDVACRAGESTDVVVLVSAETAAAVSTTLAMEPLGRFDLAGRGAAVEVLRLQSLSAADAGAKDSAGSDGSAS